MAPTTSRLPAADAVTRPRTRARREPSPLDQLPAWRDLVPVMDPAVVSAPSSPGMEALLGGLNPDQLRAVTHGTGPLLVVAGAGTGKTQVITRRIAWLIASRRAKPSEILALTFTDKAAEEMAVRVDQLVPYGYTDTAISTFHAFGDGLIREYALELGLPTDLRVLSRPEVVIFLREHLFEFDLDAYRPLGDPTRFLAALATLFSRCKDEDIAPADYLAHADRVEAEARALREAAVDASGRAEAARTKAADGALEEAGRQAELARAYATYQRLLAANGCIDFGDQVALALRLVRTSASARDAIAGRFRYILVDEFQDTNRAQAELVAALAEGHRNVTVVGDDDQAIYAFRGAAVDNILDFTDRYVGARTIVLRRNYRSLAPILDAAYRLIRFNDPDRLEVRTGVVKRLRAQRTASSPAPVRLEVFASGAEEADWIAAEIGRRMEAGAAPRDHAVLVRANGHADPILRALNVAGIPWRFSGTSGLYARPEVRLLLAFLRVVADLESSVDLYALAASDVYGLGGEDLTAIVNMARRRNRSVWAILEELERQPGILRVSPDTRTVVHRLVTRPARLRDRRPRRPGRGAAVPLPARQRAPRPARRDGHAGRRGGAPEHRPLLRDRPFAVRVARGRSRGVRGAAPGDAHRGGRRSGDGRARSRHRRGRGPDRPQGQGPRVPGRLPARHGRRPLPVGRPRRPTGPARRPRSGSAAGTGRGARRGAPAVLRGDDPGTRRAPAVARRGLRRSAGAAGLAVRAGGPRPARRGRDPGGGGADQHARRAPGHVRRDGIGRERPGRARSPSRSR